MKVQYLLVTLGLYAGLTVSANAGEPLDLETVTQIRDQGLKHSQVMETAEHLTTAHRLPLIALPRDPGKD